MGFRGYMLLFASLVFGGALFSQAQKDREEKKPVDVASEQSYFDSYLNESLGIESSSIVLVDNVVFHHNGAVISCDSAIRYSPTRIDCFRNVIINKDSTYIYGDRAEYNGDLNLARVYSPVVKVIDGDATLYTYNFTFNTLDNIGIYYGGGVMYQQDNILESEKGYYFSDQRELVAVRDVEMKNDDYTVISDSVRYNMETKIAHFFTKTYIWTDEGEIITADRGRYNTQDSTYFFYGDAYVLTDFRETRADTIDFNAKRNDAILYGNIQIDDNDNQSSAFGDFGRYWGERGETMLTKRPSLLNYNEDRNNSDTLYMRADTIFMFVVYPSDKPRAAADVETDPYAHLRRADSLPDSVRFSIADSLRPVIHRLRGQADSLRRAADSIMNQLFPAEIPELLPVDTLRTEEFELTVSDSLLRTGSTEEQITVIEEISDEDISEAEVSEPSRRRRDRNRGPYPEPWIWSRTDTLPAGTPLVLSPDSTSRAVASIPPTEMATDTLTPMEKVRELLPEELSGQDATMLLDMIDGGIPEGMEQLVSDSIDVAALRSVIEDSALPVAEREPEEAEDPTPPEVAALRKRAAELTAEADSLQIAETYIRPPLPEPTLDDMVLDSLMLLPSADSLGIAEDAWDEGGAHLEGRALKKFRKAEKKRLRAELKAARKAEKKRIREEKRAAKEQERRQRMLDRTAPATDSLSIDFLALRNSWRRLDSLMRLQIDSLESPPVAEPVSEADTTERIFRGWHDVRIWRKDMQAVCDSIVGFSQDSTIHMYIDPVMWHGESQIVSDSLTLHTKGEELDYAEFFGNPIMSSKLSEKQFNQVTGRTMTSYFDNNAVYRHDVYGNAEAFYYIQEDDDPRPVAFIVVTSSNMTFLMEDQFVRYIIARENIQWPVYPIDQIPPTQPVELKGFRWYEHRKPALEDVFDRTIRPSEREFHESLEQPKFPIAARINRRREYLIENRMWADRVDPLPAYAVEFVRSLDN